MISSFSQKKTTSTSAVFAYSSFSCFAVFESDLSYSKHWQGKSSVMWHFLESSKQVNEMCAFEPLNERSIFERRWKKNLNDTTTVQSPIKPRQWGKDKEAFHLSSSCKKRFCNARLAQFVFAFFRIDERRKLCLQLHRWMKSERRKN